MSNKFYNYSGAFLPGILARAEAESAEFNAVQAGFAVLDIQGVDSGVVNAYVITTTSGSPSGAYADGQIIEFKPLIANSGPCTVNINTIGVSSLVDSNGAALVGGALGLGWTRIMYNSGFGAWELVAPTTSTVFTGTISASPPTHKVGLTAAGGSSTAAAPIDVTFAIDQAIAPTWTAKHIFSAEVDLNGPVIVGAAGSLTLLNGATMLVSSSPGFTSAQIIGANTQWALLVTNPGGTSKGILVEAGTGSTDYSQLWQNSGGATLMSLYGDGGLTLGAPTGGDKGAGTINVAGNLYINGVAVPTSTSFANPTASIGLSAVNGVLSTVMRSDAAPALSQAIAPTWTGLHTFSATAGTMTINAPTTGVYGLLISNQAASSSSFGLQIKAGTNTSDFCFRLMNKGATQDYLSCYGNGEVYMYEPQASTGLSGTHQVGYMEVPLVAINTVNSQTHRGKMVQASGNVTVSANSSVPFPVGTMILIWNNTASSITITVTTDTLTWLPANTPGVRTLAARSIATIYKSAATVWQIWGFGLT
jgi:hypothetical protein